MSNQTLGNRYQLLRPLGEGAMGLVWLAADPLDAREVALKVISQRQGATEKSLLQFKQEFQLMTQLRHPHCCAVYDYGVSGEGEPYFTMEVVPGHGVDELLPMPTERVRAVLAQLLLALGYVHQLGFVHRDIKAANVRVRPDGTVKLMDFGLMEVVGRSAGAIAGTVGYIAPEVVKRSGVDQRADLYAVGCLAYEMITGRLPFERPTPVEVLRAHATEPAPGLTFAVDAPDAALERIVRRLLAKEPIDRFQSAFDALEALGAEVPAGLGGSLLTSPMVGRDAEHAALAERLSAVSARQPGGCVLIEGATGVGKSRLVEEFRFAVQLAGVPCARGASQDQGAPYGPLVAVLRGLLPALKAHAPDSVARLAPVLVKLLPELAVAPAADLDPPSKEKLRLQGAIAEALAALAEQAGLVMILEDWHWADALSQDALGYALRHLSTLPALTVVTRRGESAGDAAWEGATRLPISALSGAPMRRMIGSMLGTAEVPEAFVAQLAEASRGNPLFLEQLLDHLVRNRALAKSRGQWNLDLVLTPELMPSGLKALLLDKLDSLGADARALARLAAVLGGGFDIDMLAAATGLPDDRLIGGLNELRLHHVLALGDDGTYHFAQDQVQELLIGSLTPEERSRLHATAVTGLEARLGDRSPAEAPLEVVLALAEHSMGAHLADQTIRYALEAGDRSARLYANTAAERFYAAGLARLRQAAPDDRLEERLAYLQGLADVMRILGRTDEAVPLYDEALPLAEEELLDHRSLARMLTSLGKVHQMRNQLEEALAHCHRAVQVALQAGEPAEATRSLLTSCRIHTFLGHPDKALAHAMRGLALAREVGDRSRIGEAQGFLGYLLVTSEPERVPEGLAHLNEAIAIAAALNDQVTLNNLHNLLGNAQNQLGQHEAARESFRQALSLAIAIGTGPDEVSSLLNLALCGLALGRFEEAEGFAAQSHARAAAIGNTFFPGLPEALEGLALAHQSRLAPAWARLGAAVAAAAGSQNPYIEGLARQYQAESALLLGDWDGALAATQAIEALGNRTGGEPEAVLALLQGLARSRRGDRDAASAALDRALSLAREARLQGVEARAIAAQAWLALREGTWEAAREKAEQGLTLARPLGRRHLEAELEGLLGEVCLATGQAGAASRFDRMAALADAAGAGALSAQARFGQAAAAPYAAGAAALAADARERLERLTDGAEPDARSRFLAMPEHARVLSGNHVGFSLPLQAAAAERPSPATPPLGLSQGLWNF